MVDCSHANSQKDHAKQIGVCQSIVDQRRSGDSPIRGVMIESHLVGGNQVIAAPECLPTAKVSLTPVWDGKTVKCFWTRWPAADNYPVSGPAISSVSFRKLPIMQTADFGQLI